MPQDDEPRGSSIEHAIQKYDYPEGGVVLGQGWDSFRRRKTGGLCVEADIERIQTHTQELRLTRIFDKEHLFRSLSVATSGKYEAEVFSAGGSASFARSVSIDTSALNLTATVLIDKGGYFLRPKVKEGSRHGTIQLTEEAERFLKEKGQKEFAKLCGDSYVVAVRTGGRVDAYLTSKTYDYADKLDLFGTFRANYMGGEGEGATRQRESKDRTRDEFRFRYIQMGGDPEPIPVDENGLIEKLRRFGKEDKFFERAYEIHTLSYNTLPEYRGTTLTAQLPPSYFDEYANHYWRLAGLAKEYAASAGGATFIAPSFSDVAKLWNVQHNIVLSARFIDELLKECLDNYDCNIRSAVPIVFSQLGQLAASSGASRDAADWSKNLINSTVGASVFDATIGGSPVPTGPQYLTNPYRWYYFWLAMKPIRRGFAAKDAKEKSEIDLTTLLSATEKGVLSQNDQGKIDEAISNAESRLKQQIFYRRLLPISLSFCDLSMSHPMCLSTEELNKIVELIPVDLNAGDLGGAKPGMKSSAMDSRKELPVWLLPPPVAEQVVKRSAAQKLVKRLPKPPIPPVPSLPKP